jgi:hypothetical protein
MVDAQPTVVASTATNWLGPEGSILRCVFKHSIVPACLVGILVMLQAHNHPFAEIPAVGQTGAGDRSRGETSGDNSANFLPEHIWPMSRSSHRTTPQVRTFREDK